MKQVLRFQHVFFLSFFLVVLLQTKSGLAQGRPPANVVVSPVVRQTIQDQLRLIGTVEAWRTSRVATEVAGRVEQLLVRRGAKVKKGDLLAKLAASSLLLKLKEYQAKQNAALARLEKAKDNLKRSEGLMKAGLLSDKAYQDARLTVQELKENLAVNEAERLQTEDALNKKQVLAPFNGIITRELTEEGEWVQVGGGIVQLVDLSKVRVIVEVPEKYVRDVKVGASVPVQIDAVSSDPYPGKVHALIPEGDRNTRLFPVEVHVENAGMLINEGMLAKVAFGLGLSRPALMVDKDAIIRKSGKSTLFIVHEGKAVKRIVATGQSKEGMTEVTGGLKEGELVVIRGNERLREGRAVTIVSQ